MIHLHRPLRGITVFLSASYAIFCLLSVSSCSSDYSREQVVADVLSNSSDRLLKNFYNGKHKIDKKSFKETVQLYADYLEHVPYTEIEYNDEFSFKRRERLGAIFVDKNNNFIASITFKYVELEDGSKELNFIDFRNSVGLPCIKHPSRFPIKCVKLEQKLPILHDSLKIVYPKKIGDYIFNHFQQLNQVIDARTDGSKKTIIFNMGNGIVKDNIHSILEGLDQVLNLEEFISVETHFIGQPILNITYDPDAFTVDQITEVEKAVYNTTNAKTAMIADRVNKGSFKRIISETISIGFVHSEGVKVFWR